MNSFKVIWVNDRKRHSERYKGLMSEPEIGALRGQTVNDTVTPESDPPQKNKVTCGKCGEIFVGLTLGETESWLDKHWFDKHESLRKS